VAGDPATCNGVLHPNGPCARVRAQNRSTARHQTVPVPGHATLAWLDLRSGLVFAAVDVQDEITGEGPPDELDELLPTGQTSFSTDDAGADHERASTRARPHPGDRGGCS